MSKSFGSDIQNVNESSSSPSTCHTVHDIEGMEERNAYLDKALVTKLEDLQFQWRSECNDCMMSFDVFAELLTHIEISHNSCDKLSCIVGDCGERFSNVKLLTRHIVLKHCDLNSLKIYSTCPVCRRRFDNFLKFNKHSCNCVKKTSGMNTYCEHCYLEFRSFKRYVFHMQYHLPKCRPMVCLLCAKRFNNVEQFFIHVQYRHESATMHACEICDIVYKEKVVYDQHIEQSHDKRRRFECNNCSKQFNYNFMLKRHMKKCHNGEREPVKCDVCEKPYADEIQLRRHRRVHVLEAEVLVNVCTKCGLIARDHDDLVDHVESLLSHCYSSHIEEDILSSVYTCTMCSKDFRSVSDMRAHRASNVHKDGRYHCPQCDWHSDELKKLRLHIKRHYSYSAGLEAFPLRRLYLCDSANCEASYTTWDGLYKHNIRLHPRNIAAKGLDCQQLRCQLCDKQYQTKMALSIHIKRSHNAEIVVCRTCSCSFGTEQSLQKHISNTHTPIKCKHCDKVLRNNRYFKTHLRIVHKSEERYFCAICKKGFFYQSTLNMHERKVHADVVYRCGECSFTTSYKRSIAVHEAKHRNTMEFKCHVCSKEFGRKQVLETHIKSHDRKSQFNCSDRIENGCSASFVSRALLNTHIRQKHPEAADKVAPLRGKLRQRKISKEQIGNMESADDPDPVQ